MNKEEISNKRHRHNHPADGDDDCSSSSLSTLTPSPSPSPTPNRTTMSQPPTAATVPVPMNKIQIKMDMLEEDNTAKNDDNKSTSTGDDPITTGSSEEADDVFEVDQILGHKKAKGKDLWKIRWVGYGPETDTWEPTENLIGENAQRMVREYMENEEFEKQRQQEMKRKSIEYEKQLKRISKESEKNQSSTDDEEEVEDDHDGSNIEGWYGIKQGQGSREQQRLFVADRRLSKTEKLLTEINSAPGIRVLRNHLKAESRESSLIGSTSTPSPRKKRKAKGVSKLSISRSQNDVFTSESSPANFESSPKQKRKKLTKIVKEKKKQEVQLQQDGKSEQFETVKSNNKDVESERKEKQKSVISEMEACNSSKTNAAIDKPIRPDKEFGISKNLKPNFTKLSLKKDVHKLGKGQEDSSASKQKLKTGKKQQPKGTGSSTVLSFTTLSEGANLAVEIDKILMTRELPKFEGQEISQQQFEEIVMDGKVEKVRAQLHLHAQKSFLDLNHTDDFGKTLIHKLSEIKCGVTHTQCELIDLLVSNGARMDMHESNNRQIPLHLAIANRRLCHVQKLLSLRTPVNSPDLNGKPPIILALESSDSSFLKFLLKSGASFHIALEKIYKDKEHYKRQMRIIYEHESRLQKAFNFARDKVAMNMTIKNISDIFVNPIHECEIVHNFNLNTQPQLPGTDFAYALFVSIAEFISDDKDKDFCCTVEARMWGQSPVASATINGKECVSLKPGNNFVFLCEPQRDQNKIQLNIHRSMLNTDLILLTRMVLCQFHGK